MPTIKRARTGPPVERAPNHAREGRGIRPFQPTAEAHPLTDKESLASSPSAMRARRVKTDGKRVEGVVAMMNGWGGADWWLVGGIFMMFCMAMMVWMMGGMMGHGHSGQGTSSNTTEPERTLADRLARGEIDVDEYNRLLDVLRDPHRSTRT